MARLDFFFQFDPKGNKYCHIIKKKRHERQILCSIMGFMLVVREETC